MKYNFHPNLPESYIIYFDINNPYGAAISVFLHHRNFKMFMNNSVFKNTVKNFKNIKM